MSTGYISVMQALGALIALGTASHLAANWLSGCRAESDFKLRLQQAKHPLMLPGRQDRQPGISFSCLAGPSTPAPVDAVLRRTGGRLSD